MFLSKIQEKKPQPLEEGCSCTEARWPVGVSWISGWGFMDIRDWACGWGTTGTRLPREEKGVIPAHSRSLPQADPGSVAFLWVHSCPRKLIHLPASSALSPARSRRLPAHQPAPPLPVPGCGPLQQPLGRQILPSFPAPSRVCVLLLGRRGADSSTFPDGLFKEGMFDFLFCFPCSRS